MRMLIAVLLGSFSTVALAQVPAMTPLQSETFSVPGSLSNAWADFDADGDPDLAVSLKGGEIRLYRNDAGKFTNIAADIGFPGADGGEYRGLAWGDFDGDGQLDLYAGSALPKQPSRLYRQERGRFTDVAPQLGLELIGRSSRQNNWVDIDADGDVDLFTSDRIGPNRLFRNDDGRFTQIFADAPISSAQSTVGACWLDYDADGDLDLFLANQSGKQDQLWRNDGSAGFTDVAPALGIHSPGRAREEGGVGCAIGDFDNDGIFDIFVPSYGRNALWRGLPGGQFEAAAEPMGVNVDNHAVGAAFGDYDNDGRIDLSAMSYHGTPPGQMPENALFHNEGNRFVNVLDEASPLNAGDHGTAWVDIDGDGDLDLSVTKGYNTTGGHFLFRNDLPAETARQSIKVTLVDSQGHHTQAGAEVRVFAPDGRLLGAGQMHTGGGYGTQHILPAHFGIGKTRRVDIEVRFMGRSGQVIQWVRGVRPSRKAIVVRRKSGS
jgi:hypothetical protein